MSTVVLTVPGSRPSSDSQNAKTSSHSRASRWRLHLGQVEVRARCPCRAAAGRCGRGRAPRRRTRRRPAVAHAHVLLDQVPAARAHEQRRHLVAEAVLAPVVAGELDRALDRIGQVELALHDVGPRRRQGVLEVGHEAARARVQRVDDHLAVDRAGDLDAAVAESAGAAATCQSPSRIVARLGQEVERRAAGDARAALRARGEQLAPARLEALVQRADEGQRVVGEDAGRRGRGRGRRRCSKRAPVDRGGAAAPSGDGPAGRRGRRSAARSPGWRRRPPARRCRGGCAPCACPARRRARGSARSRRPPSRSTAPTHAARAARGRGSSGAARAAARARACAWARWHASW